MAKLRREIGQDLVALVLILICTGPISRAQTITAEQRLARALKSGNPAGVSAALQELAGQAKASSKVAGAVQADIESDLDCRDNRQCPKIITIDYPGATTTVLNAINDAGDAIGFYIDSAGTLHSFIRKPDGGYVAINPPGAGAVPGLGADVVSINGAGDVTGTYSTNGIDIYSYLRKRDGEFTEFGVKGAGSLGCCTLSGNINNDESVAGEYVDDALLFHGFLRFPDGTVQEFSAPNAGGTRCTLQTHNCGTFVSGTDGLNDAGDVAGWYTDNANAFHGLVRYRDGKIVYFDVDGAGTGASQGTSPSGINSTLEIPGFYLDGNGVAHGFIRFLDGYVTKFDVSGAGTAPGQGTFAENINERGDITGYYVDSTGASYGFLRYCGGRITTFGIPSAVGLYVNNNNAENAIVGYYTDAKTNVHGFLRTP